MQTETTESSDWLHSQGSNVRDITAVGPAGYGSVGTAPAGEYRYFLLNFKEVLGCTGVRANLGQPLYGQTVFCECSEHRDGHVMLRATAPTVAGTVIKD